MSYEKLANAVENIILNNRQSVTDSENSSLNSTLVTSGPFEWNIYLIIHKTMIKCKICIHYYYCQTTMVTNEAYMK